MSEPESVYDHTTIRVRNGSASPVLAVLMERRRQIDAEGFTLEHDDAHQAGEIAAAAAAYAILATHTATTPAKVVACWPLGWGDEPRDDTPERALVKAGALILAELERLERLKP